MRLNKPARKNYKSVFKTYQHLVYERIPYERALVERFMQLWEHQLIRGEYKQWAFPIETVENWYNEGKLLIFQARNGQEVVGLHFVQLHEGFIECHPPLYDKTTHPSLAKFLWFSLIKYCMDNKLQHLDMGGGLDTWQEMIKRRDEFPNPKYKWAYVPEDVKQNPNLQPNYKIVERHGEKFLEHG